MSWTLRDRGLITHQNSPIGKTTQKRGPRQRHDDPEPMAPATDDAEAHDVAAVGAGRPGPSEMPR